MGRWLDLAKQMETGNEGRDDRDDRDKTPSRTSNVPNVSNVPGASALSVLHAWEAGVASLDPEKPLGGYDAQRWQRIVCDCDHLIADFGKGAAAMGWSTIDLFGFDKRGIAGENLGGLIWRLDGGRVAFMDAGSVTYRWPFSDRVSRFGRGHIGSLGLPLVPVWELRQ